MFMTQQAGFSDPETYSIIGAAMDVHRTLGNGFLESVYRRALAIEFQRRAVPFEAEVLIDVTYKGERLPHGFRADFLCHTSVIVEVKALAALSNLEHAQVINYLKAASLHRAVLLNFGRPSLEHHRIVWRLQADRDPVRDPATAGEISALRDSGAHRGRQRL
jgi:GxxExxY protein